MKERRSEAARYARRARQHESDVQRLEEDLRQEAGVQQSKVERQLRHAEEEVRVVQKLMRDLKQRLARHEQLVTSLEAEAGELRSKLEELSDRQHGADDALPLDAEEQKEYRRLAEDVRSKTAADQTSLAALQRERDLHQQTLDAHRDEDKRYSGQLEVRCGRALQRLLRVAGRRRPPPPHLPLSERAPSSISRAPELHQGAAAQAEQARGAARRRARRSRGGGCAQGQDRLPEALPAPGRGSPGGG